jgi:hypothetical protein
VSLEPDAGARDPRETTDRSALAWGASRAASTRRRSGLFAGSAALAVVAVGALALVAHARAPEAPAPTERAAMPIVESAPAPQDLPVAASPVVAPPEAPAASSPSAPEPAPAPSAPARARATHRAGSVARQPSKPEAAAATAQQVDPLGGADIEAATSRRH